LICEPIVTMRIVAIAAFRHDGPKGAAAGLLDSLLVVFNPHACNNRHHGARIRTSSALQSLLTPPGAPISS